MHWTFIIKSHPDADGNPVLQALRMAASALADEIGISIFLTQDALSLALADADDHTARHTIQRDLLAEIRELGGEIRAVGLEWLPQTPPRPLLGGVVSAGMKELVRISKMSDQVITY
ncbi:MAG: DsrE family protein [Acidithiobacillus caldus]|nr:DsrE family protein [Acidithiobacillus caldus]